MVLTPQSALFQHWTMKMMNQEYKIDTQFWVQNDHRSIQRHHSQLMKTLHLLYRLVKTSSPYSSHFSALSWGKLMEVTWEFLDSKFAFCIHKLAVVSSTNSLSSSQQYFCILLHICSLYMNVSEKKFFESFNHIPYFSFLLLFCTESDIKLGYHSIYKVLRVKMTAECL